jgi:PHD/YefM family antitoxin component YafN of YafNO toxin-antitoxin module
MPSEDDETTYLTMNPANEKHLMESIAEDPSIRFTNDEFKKMVGKL